MGNKLEKYNIVLPSKLLRKTSLTIFEAIVKFLKEEEELNYHDIAIILGRDERNIWTVYNRSKKKRK